MVSLCIKKLMILEQRSLAPPVICLANQAGVRVEFPIVYPRSIKMKKISTAVLIVIILLTSTLIGIVNGAALQPDSRQIAVASLQLNLTPIVTSGLTKPLYLTHAGDSRLFIVERAGVIRIYQGGSLLSQPFLDISSLVLDVGFEEGLLGLAFPPTFSPSHD